jgi:hypothetical protein
MAIQTRDDGAVANGTIVFQYDYDDVSLRIVAIRCINGSAAPAWGRATQINADGTLNTSRTYATTFPANQTTVINVPTGASQRLQLFVNATGKLDGVRREYGEGALPN